MRRLTGDYPAAAADQRQALDLFRRLGDRLGQARTLDELGLVQLLTGDYPAAAASVAEAIELFRDLGSRHGLAMALNSLGELSFADLSDRGSPQPPRSGARHRPRAWRAA